MSQYDAILIQTKDGQSLHALINGDVGWLMYLREDGDAGFSSRNPAYDGPEDAVLDYQLSNGQIDQYPLAWAIPVDEVRRAVEHFRREQRPPPFVTWHNASGDGAPPDARWTDSIRRGRSGQPRPKRRPQ